MPPFSTFSTLIFKNIDTTTFNSHCFRIGTASVAYLQSNFWCVDSWRRGGGWRVCPTWIWRSARRGEGWQDGPVPSWGAHGDAYWGCFSGDLLLALSLCKNRNVQILQYWQCTSYNSSQFWHLYRRFQYWQHKIFVGLGSENIYLHYFL